MALYFDSTQATNYVMIMGNDGLQSRGCLPTESIVQLAPNSLTDYVIIPLNSNIQPLSAVGVDFAACIPAIIPLPVTAEEKLTEMCKIFPGTSSPISNTVISAFQTQQVQQMTSVLRDYYANLNGAFVISGQAAADCYLPACTIKGVFFNVYTNTADVTVTVSLIVNNVIVATVAVLAAATGAYDMGALSIPIVTTDAVRLGISTLAGTGGAYLSPITTTYIST